MPWLKLLHISAVVVWCGVLLYLPALIGARHRGEAVVARDDVVRRVFTLVATPAALLAIASGTAIFLWQGPLAGWLVVKLGLVAVLALSHGACGWLLLLAEREPHTALTVRCALTGSVAALCLVGIAGLVLGKPF